MAIPTSSFVEPCFVDHKGKPVVYGHYYHYYYPIDKPRKLRVLKQHAPDSDKNLEIVLDKIEGLKEETNSFCQYLDKILPTKVPVDEYIKKKYFPKEGYLQDLKETYALWLEDAEDALKNPEKGIKKEIKDRLRGAEEEINNRLLFSLPHRLKLKGTEQLKKEEFDKYVDTFTQYARGLVCQFKQEVDKIKAIPDEVWQEKIASAKNPEDIFNKLLGYVEWQKQKPLPNQTFSYWHGNDRWNKK